MNSWGEEEKDWGMMERQKERREKLRKLGKVEERLERVRKDETLREK